MAASERDSRETDYIGMWYRARARHGIGDDIRYGLIDPDAGEVSWQTLPHRRFDGIGGVAHLLRARGVTPSALPSLREPSAPGIWKLLPAILTRRGETPEPPWRKAAPESGDAEPLAVSWASRPETEMICRNARELGISVSVLLFWALHQVVTWRLLEHCDQGSWFFPVNMRGPVRLASDEMNHSSGFYLSVDANWTPMDLRDEIRQALRQRRHWLMWYQARVGRWVGQGGVNRLYDRMLSAKPHLGSFSMIGEWWQDMSRAGWPAHSLLCFCGPGSPAHPVSNGAMIWNGRLTLALQFHPRLGHDRRMLESCLHDWRALLLDPGAMEAAA